jgi:eukaryotic-like serine/threonine-protein kinase
MKRLILVLLVAVLSACGPKATPAPTLTPTTAPSPTPAAAPGTVLWTFKAGNSIWSSPVLSNGIIYFGSDDFSVYAVDVKTYQAIWTVKTGGVIRSRPAVADGVVFVSSDDGILHALDALTGVEKWQAGTGPANMREGGPFDVGSGYDYSQSSPTLADGLVYIGSGDSGVFAFEASTGKQVWKFETSGRVRSTAAVSDGKVYIGEGSGLLHALDAKTGLELWNQPGCDIPSPAVATGLVYCGGRGTYEVHAWDAATGELGWKFSVGHSWVDSSPVIVDDALYIGSSDAATLYAISAATGEQKWTFPTSGYAWCTPTYADGLIYMGSYNMGVSGGFYAVEAATGQQLWSLTVENGIVGSAVVDEGVVYFGGLNGTLYAVQE